jgi:hypothetical protein
VSDRRLPVRPNLDQLKHQAKDLLRELRGGNPDRLIKLADAQLALARSYQASSWPRLVQAVELSDAIWRDDLATVRDLIGANRQLLHDHVLIRRDSSWGPPMSYAANLGRDEIIRWLHDCGATDHRAAIERAALQGHPGTARLIYDLLGKPPLSDDALGGPAYTLNVEGTQVLLALGCRVVDDAGARTAPVDVVLQTDSRKPSAKHAILALYEQHGVAFPDTPTMALHRGRVDLLDAHLKRDPHLLTRTFSHREIYPAEMGCLDPIDATVGTPLDGTTLLHMCVDYDEVEIARWLLDRGMSPNVQATVGASGFGGYTPLFCSVVSQPNFWMNYQRRGPLVAPMTELLLERGADPNVRASIWKSLHPGHGDPTRHDYRDVTALSWGRRFHARVFVSEPAMTLIAAAGGVD